ncbi:MAG: 30S ribosomal protein S20 [Candidatus Dojkabacteria bacterium]
MANTSSAKKAVRVQKRRKLVNDQVRSNIRDARRELEKALNSGEKKAKLNQLLDKFYKRVDKAAKKSVGVLSQNKAARLKASWANKVASAN